MSTSTSFKSELFPRSSSILNDCLNWADALGEVASDLLPVAMSNSLNFTSRATKIVKKLRPRGRLTSFVGCSERSMAFIFIDGETQKFVVAPNVQLNETETVDMDFLTNSLGFDIRSDGEEMVSLDFDDDFTSFVSRAESGLEQGSADAEHSSNSTAVSESLIGTIGGSSASSQQPVCRSNRKSRPLRE